MRLVLMCLCILFASVAGGYGAAAQEIHNEFGLYTDLASDPGSASIDVEPMTFFDIYLTVTNPYNYDFTDWDDGPSYERAMTMVDGFYCRIYTPESGFQLAEVSAPTEIWHREGEAPDYRVAFELGGVPVPDNGIVLLLTLTCFAFDSEPKDIYLGPMVDAPFEGMMAVLDASGDSHFAFNEAHPSSGDYSLPVFGINKTVVATDNESWDGVKALFR